MLISVVNRSKKITDEEVQNVIRAINRQIAEDFEPYWSFGATLRLEGALVHSNKKNLSELRGDAILYLFDKADVDGALGYHESNWRGIPYGFVFVELAEQLGESWTVTLSHEALELVGDAQANLLVQGPHPEHPRREVFHWFEMCDAVQSDSYTIDGIAVSNFLLPAYFTMSDEPGTRNDFLGRLDNNGKALTSFGTKPGGYIGFYDPTTKRNDQWAAPDDPKARKRMELKGRLESGRGFMRKNSEAIQANEERHRASLQEAGVGLHAATVPADSTAKFDRNSIKHVFVLMLENRSFDQMLGALNKAGIDVEGVSDQHSNTDHAGNILYQLPGSADRLPAKGTDPGHEFHDVAAQLNGAAMDGFVRNFEDVAKSRKVAAAVTGQYKPDIMRYFDVGQTADGDTLPVLHTLARNFVICDHWYSSLPGPTWPNRAFVHSGTSHGIVKMPEDLASATDFRFYPQPTIYNELASADYDWRIYHGGISQTIIFPRLWRYLPTSHICSFDDFADDMKKSPDKIPPYVFIEPNFFGTERTDQHPPGSVEAGERLIANVYDTIRANDALWNESLLVILWDEHGGFYDHVAPGATVPPDDCGNADDFKRLGVRVPALLISPMLQAGVCNSIFDHTSLLRFVSERWGLPQMGRRAAQANSMEEALLWAPQLRSAAETPANLSALVKTVEPASPPATATTRAARGKVVATKAETDALDDHGRALLLAVHQARQQMQADGTLAPAPAASGRRAARTATTTRRKTPAKAPATAAQGIALFAQISGKAAPPSTPEPARPVRPKNARAKSRKSG